MVVDLGSAGFKAGFKRCVVVPHRLPVVGQLLQAGGVNFWITLATFQSRYQGIQVWLGSQTGQGGEGGIHNINPGFAGLQQHG